MSQRGGRVFAFFVALLVGVATHVGAPDPSHAAPAARVSIGPQGSTINASTFVTGSFVIQNLSDAGERITRVHFDLGTAALPDLVFDPNGTAGDPIGKPFTADSGAVVTGLVSHSHDLPNGGGFDGLELLFGNGSDHFDPSEQFTFSIDLDPTSIQGAAAPGPSDSGSVSGLELTGATITVEFDNDPGNPLVGTPFRVPASLSAAEILLEAARPAAPTLSVQGLSPPALVGQAAQVIRVQGTPGAQITLLHLESALFTAGVPGGGFDLDPFEANSVIAVSETSTTLDGAGIADLNVTLTKGELDGGFNGFFAVEHGAGTSDVSNPILFEYDPTLGRISFFKAILAGTSILNPTSLQFGPDGRLYVGQQNGLIQILNVQRNALADFSVNATETISLIRDIPNHDDDGTPNPNVTDRQITGLLVAGSAANPVIYVGSSDPRIGGGQGASDLGLDTNSGILTRLTWNGSSWVALDLVRGLPRSEENHSINGLALDTTTNTLFATIGGFTNMGGVSNNFALVPEYALSAAILSIDLDAIGSTTYDLPTLDDEDRPNPDANDPFGGNNGKNQAVIDPAGPVQVYSPGWRNVYDVVLTSQGRLYTIDNGANAGWGDIPVGEGPPTGAPPVASCTNEVSEPGIKTDDNLHFVDGPGYYGGHPNPTRANRANTFNLSNPQSPVPPGFENPIECDFLMPQSEDGAIATFAASTNGIAEFTASSFGGKMQGDLLAASFGNQIKRIKLDPTGESALLVEDLFSSVDLLPLDLTTHGDAESFPGTIWVSDYLSGNIVVFEPNPGGGICTGDDDPSVDEDSDGFDNADEIDNGTDPCSPADTPPDIDGDSESDLNDPDDDNDGQPDTSDPFALDAANGSDTPLPVIFSWDNDAPATGGILGLGFTGLMTNGVSNYSDLFDPTTMTAGGAAGVTTVGAVPAGDAQGATNSQEFGLQFGFDPQGGAFVVSTSIAAPFAGLSPSANESLGIFVGTGDQDNYAKIVVTKDGIESAWESGGASNSGASVAVALPGPEAIELHLEVDPVAATLQARYQVATGGVLGPVEDLGPPIALPAAWFAGGSPLAAGLISTSDGGTPFPATWDFIRVIPQRDVLHRVNAGGPKVAAIDGLGDWQPDTALVNTGLPYANGNTITFDANVPAGVPALVFNSERFDKPAAPNLTYTLPIIAGNDYEVRLYFAEIWFDNAGSRRFDVSIEGLPALSNLDIAAQAGPDVGTMRSFTVSPTGSALSIEFSRLVENPKISAIEIISVALNDPPVVSPPGDQTHDLREAVSLQIVASDPNQDPLTYDASGLPPGLGLDPATGSIAGKPTALGVYPVSIDVDDGQDPTTIQFLWTVLNPGGNNPPTVTNPGAQTHVIDDPISLQILASDPDNDPLTYGAAGLPSGLSIDPNTGLITGSSSTATVVPAMVTVTVSDGMDPAQVGFTWSIDPPPNNPPQVTNPGSQSNLIGDPISLQIDANDLDMDPLSYSAIGLPAGVSIHPTTGLITGAPTGSELAMVSVTVTDGEDPVVIHFDWTVTDPGAPNVVYRVNSGGPAIAATDGLGSWISDLAFVNTGSAFVAGTVPTPDASVPSGTPDTLFQSERFDRAAAPELLYSFPVAQGVTYEVRIFFAEVYFGGAGLRSFDVEIDGALVLDDFDIVGAAGPDTGTMRSFDVTASSGTLQIEFLRVIENPKVSAIEIRQLNGNRPPIVSDPGTQITEVNQFASLQISATDPDLDTLTYAASGLPSGLGIDSSTGLISGTPTATGTSNITVEVHDGTATTPVHFAWTLTSPGSGVVIHRVNAGGNQIASLDAFGDWLQDQPFANTGTLFATSATLLTDASVPASTPTELFKSERFDRPSPPSLSYAFPVTPGTMIEVRLYFAEIFFQAPNLRVFHVDIEGTRVLDSFDPYAEAGFLVGTMRSFTLSPADDTLNIDIQAFIQNPKISAIEIVEF